MGSLARSLENTNTNTARREKDGEERERGPVQGQDLPGGTPIQGAVEGETNDIALGALAKESLPPCPPRRLTTELSLPSLARSLAGHGTRRELGVEVRGLERGGVQEEPARVSPE